LGHIRQECQEDIRMDSGASIAKVNPCRVLMYFSNRFSAWKTLLVVRLFVIQFRLRQLLIQNIRVIYCTRR
jgi:hypothetical protein